jgi:hypothetical protein
VPDKGVLLADLVGPAADDHSGVVVEAVGGRLG